VRGKTGACALPSLSDLQLLHYDLLQSGVEKVAKRSKTIDEDEDDDRGDSPVCTARSSERGA
jgi:hypothetical protein